MKKIIVLVACFCSLSMAHSQVFQAAGIKDEGFNLGIEPTLFLNKNNLGPDFLGFLHIGYRPTESFAFTFKFGIGDVSKNWNNAYFGPEFNFCAGKFFSFILGAHVYQNQFGMDGTLLGNIPINDEIRIFFGVDTDLAFSSNTIILSWWVPFGFEMYLNDTVAWIVETEIGLNSSSYHIIGTGLRFYF